MLEGEVPVAGKSFSFSDGFLGAGIGIGGEVLPGAVVGLELLLFTSEEIWDRSSLNIISLGEEVGVGQRDETAFWGTGM